MGKNRSIVRVGAFLSNFGAQRVDAIADQAGLAKGALLEILALGITDEQLPGVLARGKRMHEEHKIDLRKSRQTVLSVLKALPPNELKALLEQAQQPTPETNQ